MAETISPGVEEVLNGFADVMGKLVIDQYQRHVAEMEITLPQAQVLRVLWREGELPIGQLAAALGISAPAVTQLTDRLTRKRLIKRRLSSGDRRSVLIGLAPEGHRLVPEFRQRRHRIFTGALAYLSENDQAQAIASLGKIVAALKQYDATKIAPGTEGSTNTDRSTMIEGGLKNEYHQK